jgi:hypothetical protein
MVVAMNFLCRSPAGAGLKKAMGVGGRRQPTGLAATGRPDRARRIPWFGAQ